MEVSEQRVEGHPVVRVQGDVDLSTSPELRSRLLDLLGGEDEHLLLDLSEVSYMDSSGLATLVEALQKKRGGPGRLVLFGLSDRIRRIFELAHLQSVFTIHSDQASALEALQEAGGS